MECIRNEVINMPGIKLLFAGDFCPIDRVEQMILDGRSEDVYGDALPRLYDKDLSVINLECPLTKRDSPISKSGPNLRARPEVVECIKTGKFDIVSLQTTTLQTTAPPL